MFLFSNGYLGAQWFIDKWVEQSPKVTGQNDLWKELSDLSDLEVCQQPASQL